MKKENTWTFAADRGGTFTDIIGFSPLGNIHTLKLLSQSPHYSDAATEGIYQILSRKPGEIKSIRIGTTIGTNALLESTGAKVCLVITKGFGDILHIGYQNRPKLFKLRIEKSPVLYSKVVEVNERVNAEGDIFLKLDEEAIRAKLKNVLQSGIKSLAIVLLHSWKNPYHEKKIQTIAEEVGFSEISRSSSLMPLIKIVGRGQTTVVDAYITPILKEYIHTIRKKTRDIPVKFMQSNGGITDAKFFRGKDSMVSGPTGGVIGYAHIAKLAGYEKAIGFDMGGTSTDVSRYDGEYEKVFETEIGGYKFQADMLNIITIAAGGGSLLQFDGEKMLVGPESAGAMPGPACYRHDGPLTITDANLILGRLIPQYFPQIFGTNNNEMLDSFIVKEKFEQLQESIAKSTTITLRLEDIAEGFIQIANENMCQAIKQVSVAKGFNIEEYALVCFGGAGAQHACSLAKSLGIKTIIVPEFAGILSAYGIAIADITRNTIKSTLLPFEKEYFESLKKDFLELERKLVDKVKEEGICEENIVSKYFVDIRPKGTEKCESVLYSSYQQTKQCFYKKYKKHYAIDLPYHKELEIVNIRIEITGETPKPKIINDPVVVNILTKEDACDKKQTYFSGQYYDTSIFMREKLKAGSQIHGPAIIVEKNSTVCIEPGFSVKINEFRHLVITSMGLEKTVRIQETRCNPILLEIFHNLFQSIAEQMGVTLVNTAYSVNMKERMDFSCAVFDAKGNLVANAPHIPVHLGAMGESVKGILETYKDMSPGDVYVSNNPFAGGSHLPDITVVTPVFNTESICTFIVACRGHHADIGGITPGSMPPFSSSIEEEGIIIDAFLLVKNGSFREKEIVKLLTSGKYPARNIKERLSDLRAQIAANNKGRVELENIIEHYGIETVTRYMQYIQDNAANMMKKALGKLLGNKQCRKKHFIDFLDNGANIEVSIIIERGENPPYTHQATIDFSGTYPQLSGNLNAPFAVVKACVLYVFRTLIEENIPLNAGCLKPLIIKIPENSLLNPQSGAAVAGGNVETSQRIVDVLYGALGVVAASQGTMNNVTFGKDGDDGFGYYETICGGAGAGADFRGEDAVHTHMTNTRITDPEVFEHRYSGVQLKEFSIRKNSGGKGRNRGGDGVIRRIQFLEPYTVGILSERRTTIPYGLEGGEPGLPGKNTLTSQGKEIPLEAKTSLKVKKGDILNIYTPGGGGFGKKE